MKNIIQVIHQKQLLLKKSPFLKNDLNNTKNIMSKFILHYIEKTEEYFHEYYFRFYVYTKFASYLLSNYFLKLKDYYYVWNSIKFVNQNWFTYNSKTYNFRETVDFFY